MVESIEFENDSKGRRDDDWLELSVNPTIKKIVQPDWLLHNSILRLMCILICSYV